MLVLLGLLRIRWNGRELSRAFGRVLPLCRRRARKSRTFIGWYVVHHSFDSHTVTAAEAMNGNSRAPASYRLPKSTEIPIGVVRADVIWSGVSKGFPPRLIAH